MVSFITPEDNVASGRLKELQSGHNTNVAAMTWAIKA
jgi:hypothetical protein